MNKPQYIQIYESLRDDIQRGTRSAGDKLPSIRKFAKQWEVSNITIIKAFEKLKQNGFVTTNQRSGFFVSGGATQARKFKKIGLLSPISPQSMHEHENLHAMCKQLENTLVSAGHLFSLHLGRWQAPDGGHSYLSAQEIQDYGLDAVIIVYMYNFHYLSQLSEIRIPILCVDADASILGIDSVYFDNLGSAMRLCQNFIKQGHKDILFVGGPTTSPLGSVKRIYADPATTERFDGCQLACQNAEHVNLHSVIPEGARNAEKWAQYAREYIKEHPQVSAIVSEADLGNADALAQIPQAIFSSSNTLAATHVQSAAFCDFDELGRQAPHSLMYRFENPNAPTIRKSLNVPIIQ